MARFFLSTSEHSMLKQKSANYDAVVQAVLSITEGVSAEDVTPEMIAELLTETTAEADTKSLETATARITSLETEQSELLSMLDALDPTVEAATDATAKVEAVKVKLASRPGAKIEAPQGESGTNDTSTDEVDQEFIDSLSHNKIADQSIV